MSNPVHRLKLRHLRLAEALASTGNMHRAAEELHVSQPAATKILQDLEEILDAPVFTRGTGPMKPTTLGEYVLSYARRMLRETDRFQDGLANMKAGGFGTLTLGAVLAASPSILPQAIVELKARRPLVLVQVNEGSSDRLLRALAQNQYELILARFTEPHHVSTFDMQPIADEPLAVFASADHPVAGQSSVPLRKLVQYPWVIQPPGSPTRQILDRAFAGDGGAFPLDVIETASILMTIHLVMTTSAISVLPLDILSTYAADRLHLFPIKLKSALSPFGVITRKGAELSENAQTFISIVKERSATSKA